MGNVDQRLQQLGIQLPTIFAPRSGMAVPWRYAGGLVFLAGQGPNWEGSFQHQGRVGDTISLEDGKHAARLCALNLIYFLREACGGDLDRAEACLMLQCYVCSPPDFLRHPEVANGASELISEIFGPSGSHARTAVGVAGLPKSIPVEVSAIWKICDDR